jgi:hypothetical protein
MAASISDTVLRMVLAQANKDQNQHYPPAVFESHYQLATNYLIDECARRYPGTQSIQDLIKPYINNMMVAVKAGEFNVPVDYRHLLGFGIYLDAENNNVCAISDLPENPTDQQLSELIAARKDQSRDLTVVSIGRWNNLTNSAYKKPDLKDPITCLFRTGNYRISPYNVPIVEVRYIVKTRPFIYGYSMNADDTYYFDDTKTTEALWEENAIQYLFKGINLLYANYVRDPEGSASAKDLRDAGLL